MAPTAAAQDSPSARGVDVLTAEEFGRRVQIGRVQTVRSLCAQDLVPGARKVTRPDGRGQEWEIYWPTFYEALAGPGVAEGEIVTSRQLARYLGGVPDRAVRRASAAPGTPGKWPGLQLGKGWRYAMPAVQAREIGWSQPDGQDAAVPEPPAAGPAPSRPAPPAKFMSATQSLEYPAPAPGQAPPAHSPGRGPGAAARRRRLGHGPGHRPSPR
jgi:hypothetical protein